MNEETRTAIWKLIDWLENWLIRELTDNEVFLLQENIDIVKQLIAPQQNFPRIPVVNVYHILEAIEIFYNPTNDVLNVSATDMNLVRAIRELAIRIDRLEKLSQ